MTKEELYSKILDCERKFFNKNYNISIKGIPVEIYVELDEPKAKSGGIYSLENGWLKEPIQQEIPEINEEEFEKLFSEWENKYFDLMSQYQYPLDESLKK